MSFRVALAQLNPLVGDIDGNVALIVDAWRHAADHRADLVVFPELVVTGYPQEDLLLRDELLAANADAIDRLNTEGPAGNGERQRPQHLAARQMLDHQEPEDADADVDTADDSRGQQRRP